ncbi:S8 family serine peptidase [Thermoleophilia bacterium SCSIO 60948]|nr:S8 family serine peptidase [Thermoleophilia bacterium SCSIO 60948]
MRRQFPVLAAIACALALPGTAVAADELSPRLDELAKPRLADASPAEQARAVSLTTGGPGSLVRLGDGLVFEARFTERAFATATDSLERAGATTISASREYLTVTAVAEPGALEAVGSIPGIEYVEEAQRPKVGRAGVFGESAAVASRGAGSCGDRTIGEGDAQLRADEVRDVLGVDGTGASIGILSDSFDTARYTDEPPETTASQDVADGDLPGAGNPCGRTTPVDVIREWPAPNNAGTVADLGQVDEGRAMLQIVHDLAPGARLSFATANFTETQFAENIATLAAEDPDVMVDDVNYFGEPVYQDGVVANAIADAADQGVAHFTSVGNQRQEIDGQGVGAWEADAYRPAPCPEITPTFGEPLTGADCMDFDPGAGVDTAQNLALQSGSQRFSFHWAEPQYGVTTNLDFYLVDESGNVLASADADEINQSKRPAANFAIALSQNREVRLVIRRSAGTGTPQLLYVPYGRQTALPEHYGEGDRFAGSVVAHYGSEAAQAVGAVRYNNPDRVEAFSIRGQQTQFFAPVDGTTPAAPLPSPETEAKPDVVATNGGLTSFFYEDEPDVFRFFGTSAAAPHAGAVAALQVSADPDITRELMIANQESTARAVPLSPQAASGAGLLDAFEAVSASVAPAAKPVITKRPKPRTSSNRAVFAFRSTRAAGFRCSLDGKRAKPCSSPVRYTVAKPGRRAKRHTFSVFAVNGLGERTAAAKASWSVQKRR